jgi:hypothetical protein
MSKPNDKPQAAAAATTPAGSPQGQNKGHGGAAKGPSGGSSKEKISVLPGMCMADTCKHKSEKANFCMEHFDWFKEGLITKEGRKPTDFEKKHFDYQRRKAKRAA